MDRSRSRSHRRRALVPGASVTVGVLAVFVLTVTVLLATAATATAAPGDRTWVRGFSSSTRVEDFLAVANGQQRTVYAVGIASATEESGKMLVARYSADGKRLWAHTYSAGGDSAYGRCLLVVPGGVIVAGTAGNVAAPNRLDIVVVKYAGDGRRLWTRRYDGPGHRNDDPSDLELGPGGTVYVGGTSVGEGTGKDYVLMQVAQSYGSVLWTRRYDGAGKFDDLRAVHADLENGAVYVTGRSAGDAAGVAAATIKYSASGRRLWARRLHEGAGPTYGAGVALNLEDKVVYVAGATYGGVAAGWDAMLVQLSMATGAKKWVRTAAVPHTNERVVAFADYVRFVPGGYGFALAGSSSDPDTLDETAFVTTWALDGTPLWQDADFKVGLPGDDAGYFSVTDDSEGSLYCGGFTSGSGGLEDFTVVKYSPAGAFVWDNVYDSPAHKTDICRVLTMGYGGLYAAGFRSKTTLDTNALLVKYER